MNLTRRDALTGVGAVALGGFLSDFGRANETNAAPTDETWRFVELDPRKAAALAYEYYGTNACLYGAFKGAVLAYADAVESVDADAAARARNFPFVAFRCGRGGFGRLKELCGAVAGSVMFFNCFVDDYADVCRLAAELGEYAKTAELPEYVPENAESADFLRVVANGLTCREMGGAWVKAASEEQMKLVGERCKRHTASIARKAAEILNAYFAEKASK